MVKIATMDDTAPLAPPMHVAADSAMRDWISSDQALPQEGQPVEFVLEYRDIAMRGVYRERVFRTRWSRYEPSAICEWRCVDSLCA